MFENVFYKRATLNSSVSRIHKEKTAKGVFSK